MQSYGYKEGLLDGLPIGLGYLSVSFGFAIWAINQGLPGFILVLMSGSNLTSAGQVAGVTVMAAGGLFMELALTEAIINLRYALMSVTLTQKLSPTFSLWQRMLAAFFVTDEIFAVSSTRKGLLTFPYMMGLGCLPWIGWTLGTALGAFAGSLLPAAVCAALGIAIYGMFTSLIVPAAMEEKGVLLAVAAAIGLGLILRYVPVFSFLSEGFVIIISAVGGACVAAWLIPAPKEAQA
ncbi:MAG: AzlC family ABC transporter permease [Clostridia bacterium]|nr:AzlC family ABC transporter permease [Clostridia bacterium]